MPHLRVRRSGRRAVPGQTLERGKGRNQVAASIKEQNCDRQINKIYRDKMVPYLSSFYGTEQHEEDCIEVEGAPIDFGEGDFLPPAWV